MKRLEEYEVGVDRKVETCMVKLNLFLKCLEEKDAQISKLEDMMKETKEFCEVSLKERDLEISNLKAKIEENVESKNVEKLISDKVESHKFQCKLCDFTSNSK